MHDNLYKKYLMRNLSLVFLALFFLGISCKKSDSVVQDNTIPIAGLLSLTGNWSSLGLTSQEAITLAVSDVNAYLQQVGSSIRFSASFYDTKLDTALAQAALNDALAKNIHYVVGPQSSAEVAAIKNSADANKILIVSQGSTASSLAIAGDGIFRFCPGDSVEGNALAQTIVESGRTHLITLARDDAGNKGLQQRIGNSFSAFGGTIEAMTPYATTVTDFTELLAALKIKLQDQVTAYGADKVAVYLASFDECIDLFKQALPDPVFSSVRWYGGDGVVLSSALIADVDASSFAIATDFMAPNFGLPLQPHPSLSTIAATIKGKTGIDPDAYAFAAYDAVWVLAKTALSFKSSTPDFNNLKDVFRAEADRYFGITGPVQLNTAGDRSTGSFDYWGIAIDGGVAQWKFVGKSQ